MADHYLQSIDNALDSHKDLVEFNDQLKQSKTQCSRLLNDYKLAEESFKSNLKGIHQMYTTPSTIDFKKSMDLMENIRTLYLKLTSIKANYADVKKASEEIISKIIGLQQATAAQTCQVLSLFNQPYMAILSEQPSENKVIRGKSYLITPVIQADAHEDSEDSTDTYAACDLTVTDETLKVKRRRK
jgi:hypothetical protein